MRRTKIGAAGKMWGLNRLGGGHATASQTNGKHAPPEGDAVAMTMARAADQYARQLAGIKAGLEADFGWYPYASLANFHHIAPLLREKSFDSLVAGGPILDIGAADGDVAFFLETLGYRVGILDHAPTNFNGLRGARRLREHFGSTVTIDDVDLDSNFKLPGARYDLVLFLGILYHLKNPFYVLEQLARRARHLLVSTRIARFSPGGETLRDIPVAYLLGPDEANGDPTNFWIFSEIGLRRLFDRTGWQVEAFYTVGDTVASDPARSDHDERAFALLRSTLV